MSEARSGFAHTTLWLATEVGTNDEAKKETVRLFGEEVFETPKPERLIRRILHIATNSGDLVLDSFLGSGPTATVAHKMGRRWIGVEIGEHARTHCALRLRKVIEGEEGGISRNIGWQGGGGFRFCTLGAPVFAASGRVSAEIRFRKHLLGADRAPLIDGEPGGEEFQCACALDGLDGLDEVEVWVRNVARHHDSFWLPRVNRRFYPDFVVKLADGRILVVEYKGAALVGAPEERGKTTIGKLWARTTGNLFVTVEKMKHGLDPAAQMKAAIRAGAPAVVA